MDTRSAPCNVCGNPIVTVTDSRGGNLCSDCFGWYLSIANPGFYKAFQQDVLSIANPDFYRAFQKEQE